MLRSPCLQFSICCYFYLVLEESIALWTDVDFLFENPLGARSLRSSVLLGSLVPYMVFFSLDLSNLWYIFEGLYPNGVSWRFHVPLLDSCMLFVCCYASFTACSRESVLLSFWIATPCLELHLHPFCGCSGFLLPGMVLCSLSRYISSVIWCSIRATAELMGWGLCVCFWCLKYSCFSVSGRVRFHHELTLYSS